MAQLGDKPADEALEDGWSIPEVAAVRAPVAPPAPPALPAPSPPTSAPVAANAAPIGAAVTTPTAPQRIAIAPRPTSGAEPKRRPSGPMPAVRPPPPPAAPKDVAPITPEILPIAQAPTEIAQAPTEIAQAPTEIAPKAPHIEPGAPAPTDVAQAPTEIAPRALEIQPIAQAPTEIAPQGPTERAPQAPAEIAFAERAPQAQAEPEVRRAEVPAPAALQHLGQYPADESIDVTQVNDDEPATIPYMGPSLTPAGGIPIVAPSHGVSAVPPKVLLPGYGSNVGALPAMTPSGGVPAVTPFGGVPAATPHVGAPAAAPQETAAPPVAPSPYGPGSLIGEKYRLVRLLGQGGMGAVWLALSTSLEVEVAVKLMRRDRASPETAARFATEARAAARLGHPGIVRVFDFGETPLGDPYIVMELLHGESFGALLHRKRKLAPTIAVQTLLPVAHALAAAHAKGIVHRDMKPDNILLAKEESGVVAPKILDFGIAKLVDPDVERHFTIAGEVLGSPDYMSPEQARGEDDIDHRTDIWTFSVLLYEAVTGKRPFTGSNYNALLASIIATKPASFMDHGIAEQALWAIASKGLSKERDGRWQSIRELGIELARWALDHGVEHDLVGTSLSAQWLEPTRRRLFTVQGSAPPPAAPTDGEEAAIAAAIPKPPPLGALAAAMPAAVDTTTNATAAPSTQTMPPFVPRRRPWITVAVLVACALGLGYAVLSIVLGGPKPPPLLAGPTAAATEALSSSAEVPPEASSAAPTVSASVRPTGSPKSTSPRASASAKGVNAPKVKDIRF